MSNDRSQFVKSHPKIFISENPQYPPTLEDVNHVLARLLNGQNQTKILDDILDDLFLEEQNAGFPSLRPENGPNWPYQQIAVDATADFHQLPVLATPIFH